jgi:steroid delta-isomerase-like uncharacterized protein
MSEQNKKIMRRILSEVWNQGNLETIDELLSPDFVTHFLPPGSPPGRDGFRQYVSNYRAAFPDVHVDIEDQIAEGNKVVTRITIRGTHEGTFMGIPATGKKIQVAAIVIVRFDGGRNMESWVEQDRLGMMQQLGVVPSPS